MSASSFAPDLGRRKLLAVAAGWSIALKTGATPRRATLEVDGGHLGEKRHLGMPQATMIRNLLQQNPDWLTRHLDLQTFRSASLEAIHYLAQCSVPFCSVNFDGFSPPLLNALLQLDTVNLRFGSRFDLKMWTEVSPDALKLARAFVLEIPHPKGLSAIAAENVARHGCQSIFLGEFDELLPDTAASISGHQGTLSFDVTTASNLEVARALTNHAGDAIYINSDHQPAAALIREFRSARRRSISVDPFLDELGRTRWHLAWEPTSYFVERQHRKFLHSISKLTC